jgi:hypothetical protein
MYDTNRCPVQLRKASYRLAPKLRMLAGIASGGLLFVLALILMALVSPSSTMAQTYEMRRESLPTRRISRSGLKVVKSPAIQVTDAEPNLFSPQWISTDSENTNSIAWGDVDGDGDLDLAVGNAGSPNQLFLNENGVISSTAVWSSPESDHTNSVAWGDVDGDGDLDLAVGNGVLFPIVEARGEPNRIYLNDTIPNGLINLTPVWTSTEADLTTSVAWGDVNGDAKLDLAIGNYASQDGRSPGYENLVYANETESSGIVSLMPVWHSSDADITWSVAWGDVNGDGLLDLAVGNGGDLNNTVPGQYNRIYLNNQQGALNAVAAWTSPYTLSTVSLAWGDYDNDGDPDLAVANGGLVEGQRNQIFENETTDEGDVDFTLVWTSTEVDTSSSVAWGDVDGDGDLDLAVGNGNPPRGQIIEYNRLYRNEGMVEDGRPPVFSEVWHSQERDFSTSIAWGDYDNDGDLDLATGNANLPSGQPNRIYRNEQLPLTSSAVWSSTEVDNTFCLAWGDYDGDRQLDLATGNVGLAQTNRLYHNTDSTLISSLAWNPVETNLTLSLAWGDFDRDNDLDLAVGNVLGPNRLYLNENGIIADTAAWYSDEWDDTNSVAWGDVDGDLDLDLAVGNGELVSGEYLIGRPNRVYVYDGLNNQDLPDLNLAWSSVETDVTASVAWGDVDGDGDLDLAAGNFDSPNRLYRNDNGQLTSHSIWESYEEDSTVSVAWGDVDGDGDLDLAVGNNSQPNRVYRNDGGVLTSEPSWSSIEVDATTSVAWGDVDGDGDLDLAVGNGAFSIAYEPRGEVNRLYRNDGLADDGLTPILTPAWTSDEEEVAATISVAWGDVDADGDLDLAAGNVGASNQLYRNTSHTFFGLHSPPLPYISRPIPPPNANFYAIADISQGPTVSLTYTLYHPQSLLVQRVIGMYSLDGGGKWSPAVADAGTQTSNIGTSPNGTTYVYDWHIYDSGVLGQSDNVVLRLVAVPAVVNRANGIPGPYLYGSYAATTFPFRVRGNQIRVVDEDGHPKLNAMVYRLGTNGANEPYADLTGEPFRTDGQGYLQGRGEIQVGDRLLALAPVALPPEYTERFNDTLRLYHTNGTPTPVGLNTWISNTQSLTVTEPGVQQVAVSPKHPLLLFDLDVSLEWDASQDPTYLNQLAYDLQQASEFLYDFTDGQVALGEVTVHQNGDDWLTSDVVIYTSNRLRPLAIQGGLVVTPTDDPGNIPISIRYLPGQIRMGATWNRRGDPGETGRLDWQLALAHELAHYLLFQEDTYLGLNEENLLIPIDTTHPHTGCSGSAMGDVYHEYNSEFLDDSGWGVGCEDTLAHRILGRSEWATIQTWYPFLHGSDQTGENSGPGDMPFALTSVQVLPPITPTTLLDEPFYVIDYKGLGGSSSSARAFLLRQVPAGDYVLDLGSPVSGQDRVLNRGMRSGDRLCVFDPPRHEFGCLSVKLNGSNHVPMEQDVEWSPVIQVTPVGTPTLAIDVELSLPLTVDLRARLFPEYGWGSPAIRLEDGDGDGVYSGVFPDFDYPPAAGHVGLYWGDDPAPKAMVAYAIGGNPGVNPFSHGHGPFSHGHGPFSHGHGPFSHGHGPFVVSPDGQMALFTPQPEFEEGDLYVIHGLAAVPELPEGKVLIGQAYRLVSAGEPVQDPSVSFQYLGIDAFKARVDEAELRIHFWDGESWQALETVVDEYYNMATAHSQGDGVYALLAWQTEPSISAFAPSVMTNEVTHTLVITGECFLAQAQVLLQGAETYTYPTGLTYTTTLTAVITPGVVAGEYGVVVVNSDDARAEAPGTLSVFNPSPACFYDDFESGPNQWERSGEWGIVTIPNTSDRAMTDSPARNYNSAITPTLTHMTAITSPAFSLANCYKPLLSFRHDYVIDNRAPSQDVARVEITTDDGATWTELVSYAGGYPVQDIQVEDFPEWTAVGWEQVGIDLSAYDGSVRLRFSLEVDQFGADRGWVIDNVEVKSTGVFSPDTWLYLPLILNEE